MSSDSAASVNSAYIVEGKTPEAPGIIVFAQDEDHALILGVGSADLQALPADALKVEVLDGLAEVAARSKPRALSWSNPNDLRLYRNLGWLLEGETCKQCSRFTSDRLPESRLNAAGICCECFHPVIEFPHADIRVLSRELRRA